MVDALAIKTALEELYVQAVEASTTTWKGVIAGKAPPNNDAFRVNVWMYELEEIRHLTMTGTIHNAATPSLFQSKING